MKTKTQEEKIYADLLKGKKLTPLQSLDDYDCWALSSRIADINRNLRKQKRPEVEKVMIKQNGKSFAQYSLSKVV